MSEKETPETGTNESDAGKMPAEGAVSVEALQAQLAESKKHISTLNNENASRRKALEKFEAEEEERKAAGLSEMEKLQAKLNKLEKANRQMEAASLKRQVAADVGLPAAMASRLQGNTVDELKADATALLEMLPPAQKPAPHIPPTNPGQGGTEPKMSDKERYQRLLGNHVNPFDMATAIKHGGGVVFAGSDE